MKAVTNIQENAEDIYAEAQQINVERVLGDNEFDDESETEVESEIEAESDATTTEA